MGYYLKVYKDYLENDGIVRSDYDHFVTDDYDLLMKVYEIIEKHYSNVEGYRWYIEIVYYDFNHNKSILLHKEGGEL